MKLKSILSLTAALMMLVSIPVFALAEDVTTTTGNSYGQGNGDQIRLLSGDLDGDGICDYDLDGDGVCDYDCDPAGVGLGADGTAQYQNASSSSTTGNGGSASRSGNGSSTTQSGSGHGRNR